MHDPTWKTHPEATSLVEHAIQEVVSKSAFLRVLASRLADETGTRLIDWVDRISVPHESRFLESLGFVITSDEGEPLALRHSTAQLPWVLPLESIGRVLAIHCESIEDFALSHRLDRRCLVVGEPLASVRRLRCDQGGDFELWAVERHGSWGWNNVTCLTPADPSILEAAQSFKLRRRDFTADSMGFDELAMLIDSVSKRFGIDRTADLFFSAERGYWQSRNRAGQYQKMRQDRLGLGWANHDHHTYRSSRASFQSLIQCLEKLGMECRERFYAGREAGWGAQVMEQPNARVVVFADVDLAPEEIVQDFSHEPLPPQTNLGTVGLWCALHGEAILQAGMHHLECQFHFEEARQQLTQLGIPSMKPFTDLPHLKQSFTVGENWPVSEERLQRALLAGWISVQQANQFRASGVLGSHLEILQRNDGYKGFNPKGISDIILETDPRLKVSMHDEKS